MRVRLLGYLVLLASPTAIAQHSDILLEVMGGQIVLRPDAVSGDPNAPCIFDGTLGELGVPGFTDDPGFNSDSLAAGEIIGFNITGALQFWDANGLTNPPAGERIEIADQSSAVVADGSSTNVSGFNFGQAGPTGTLHRHIQFWVQHPDFDANDPFTNPISVGAFIIPLEITSTAHATSDTFYLMFNSGLAAPVFEERVAAAGAHFCATCVGDLNDDGVVDLSDLAAFLSDFGCTGGGCVADGDGDGDTDLADLSQFLSVFGTICG